MHGSLRRRERVWGYWDPPPRRNSESGKIAALERGIGLVDHLQSLFRRLVPAVRVRMVAFDQLLVARLQPRERQRQLQREDRERLLLGRARTRALPWPLDGLVGI